MTSIRLKWRDLIVALLAVGATELSAIIVDTQTPLTAYKNKTPDKPFSGRFNLRVSSDLHRKVAVEASKQGISLNTFVEQTLQKAV